MPQNASLHDHVQHASSTGAFLEVFQSATYHLPIRLLAASRVLAGLDSTQGAVKLLNE
jgi:hypothetical protein